MIVWLASYPKSGNTWIRSFLSSLLFTKDGTADLEVVKKIPQYPLRKYFKELVDDFENLEQLAENWIPSQDLLNLDNKIKFFKTHHIMCNITNKSFTNYKNTFGVIYIVRDPRNVITSILNHFSKKNYLEAMNFLFDEHKIIGLNNTLKDEKNTKDNNILTLISSWKTHYNSWKTFKKNFLLIKYENLINDKENEFQKIRIYLQDKLNLSFDDKKFEKAIESNLFQNLKDIELKKGFIESVTDNDNKKKNFFHLGPKNDFKKILDEKISSEIEKNFFDEMKELDYI